MSPPRIIFFNSGKKASIFELSSTISRTIYVFIGYAKEYSQERTLFRQIPWLSAERGSFARRYLGLRGTYKN
jgi:hypothetical protein